MNEEIQIVPKINEQAASFLHVAVRNSTTGDVKPFQAVLKGLDAESLIEAAKDIRTQVGAAIKSA